MSPNMFEGMIEGFVRLTILAILIAILLGAGVLALILWACGLLS